MAYNASADIRARSLALREIIDAATLLYILDPAGRQRHLATLNWAFDRLPDLGNGRVPDPSVWDANVPVANALFSAILALDVAYYDLEPARRREVEEILGRLVRENREESWINSSYALRGLWALFTGDRRAFERYKQLYIDAFYEALTEDSVFNAGPGYALARFVNPDREQKHLFMDVLEFTGEGGFYGDPRIGRFYEWLLAHAMAPDGRSYTFGDTSPVASLLDGPAGAALYRAHRFSEAAGAYAAWWAQQMRRPGSFVAYVLADRAPEPVRPEVSLIAADGGAWFVHTGESGARVGSPGGQASSPGGSGGGRQEWIAGALWNPRSSGGHAHKDVNAVHLAAYGEHLVVNSGYRGWGQGGLGFSWTYVHDEAISSNTAPIDGADHRLKHGAGIQEGFVAERFMYARGDSGSALPNGVHIRDFIFVLPAHDGRHAGAPESAAGVGPPGDAGGAEAPPGGASGEAGIGGYWILIDRIRPVVAGASMSVALHPYSAEHVTVEEAVEYE